MSMLKISCFTQLSKGVRPAAKIANFSARG